MSQLSSDRSPLTILILVGGILISIGGICLLIFSFLFWGGLVVSDETGIKESILEPGDRPTSLFPLSITMLYLAALSWPCAFIAGGGVGLSILGVFLVFMPSFRTASPIRYLLAGFGADLAGGCLFTSILLFIGFFVFSLGFEFADASDPTVMYIAGFIFALIPTPIPTLGFIVGSLILGVVIFTWNRQQQSLYQGQEIGEPRLPSSLEMQYNVGVSPSSPLCPNCGSRNVDSAKFCGNCGKEILTKQFPQRNKTCPFCSAQNPPDAKFCLSCGKHFSS